MKVPYLDINKSFESIYEELQKSFTTVLKSGRIVLGDEVKEFEKQYAHFSTTKFCVGVGCGLDAIELSLEAAGIGKGDEVILPSNAYIAALIAVSRLNATPVLVEPKIDTYNIDPSKIEQAITKRTKAIIPVHFFGQSCEMDPILKIAKKYNLAIIEDNAQSHGSTYKGKLTGSFGVANATSFYPSKNMGALGEAGAITTNNANIYKSLLMLRNYGESSKYKNDVIGHNSRLDELQAAFLKIRLKKLSETTKARKRIASIYLDELKDIQDLLLPITEQYVDNVYHIFPIRTKRRDELQKYLFDNGVITIVHYPIPPYLQKAYKYLGYKKSDFPVAQKLADTSLSLPIFPEMTDDQVRYVAKIIKSFFKKL